MGVGESSQGEESSHTVSEVPGSHTGSDNAHCGCDSDSSSDSEGQCGGRGSSQDDQGSVTNSDALNGKEAGYPSAVDIDSGDTDSNEEQHLQRHQRQPQHQQAE